MLEIQFLFLSLTVFVSLSALDGLQTFKGLDKCDERNPVARQFIEKLGSKTSIILLKSLAVSSVLFLVFFSFMLRANPLVPLVVISGLSLLEVLAVVVNRSAMSSGAEER